MIPPIIDAFCACPSITVSLCDSLTPPGLHSDCRPLIRPCELAGTNCIKTSRTRMFSTGGPNCENLGLRRLPLLCLILSTIIDMSYLIIINYYEDDIMIGNSYYQACTFIFRPSINFFWCDTHLFHIKELSYISFLRSLD